VQIDQSQHLGIFQAGRRKLRETKEKNKKTSARNRWKGRQTKGTPGQKMDIQVVAAIGGQIAALKHERGRQKGKEKAKEGNKEENRVGGNSETRGTNSEVIGTVTPPVYNYPNNTNWLRTTIPGGEGEKRYEVTELEENKKSTGGPDHTSRDETSLPPFRLSPRPGQSRE